METQTRNQSGDNGLLIYFPVRTLDKTIVPVELLDKSYKFLNELLKTSTQNNSSSQIERIVFSTLIISNEIKPYLLIIGPEYTFGELSERIQSMQNHD